MNSCTYFGRPRIQRNFIKTTIGKRNKSKPEIIKSTSVSIRFINSIGNHKIYRKFFANHLSPSLSFSVSFAHFNGIINFTGLYLYCHLNFRNTRRISGFIFHFRLTRKTKSRNNSTCYLRPSVVRCRSNETERVCESERRKKARTNAIK